MASGADTHTHTYIRTNVILRNQARAGLWPARAWFKNTHIVYKLMANFQNNQTAGYPPLMSSFNECFNIKFLSLKFEIHRNLKSNFKFR